MIKKDIQYNQRDLENHIAVGAFISNEAGELLVFRHHKWGFWTIPVGKGEVGEDSEAALRREMKEELGIETYDAKVAYERLARYDRVQKHLRIILVGFELTNIVEPVQNLEPEKHSEMGFLPISEIAQKPALSDQLMIYLDKLGVAYNDTMDGAIET